jgi:hypothetical protein
LRCVVEGTNKNSNFDIKFNLVWVFWKNLQSTYNW